MKNRFCLIAITLGAALGYVLIGCNATPSDAGSDPYARLSCSAKRDKMTQELLAFEAAKQPGAKRSAVDSPTIDTTPRLIQVLRGYPPVVPVSPTESPGIQVQDSRSDSPTSSQVRWVPPVGLTDTSKVADGLPVPDTTSIAALPTDISVIQIVSTGAYKAHITIVDYRDQTLRTLDQQFGYSGELNNPQRAVPNGYTSFLVWDNKDAEGRQAPDGTYLWKIALTFETQLTENRTQLTGLLGAACQAELAP